MSLQINAGPSAGTLTLQTGRAGIGSKVGHDLTLRVGTWSALAEVEDSGHVSSIRVVAALPSLEVLKADGGLKPLSDKDKDAILSNALSTLKARIHPEAVFEADGLQLSAGNTRVTGQLSIGGATKPQQMDVTVTMSGDRADVQVRCQVVQSQFGIKPYSGMLGALKVRDMVEVTAEFSASSPRSAEAPAARARGSSSPRSPSSP